MSKLDDTRCFLCDEKFFISKRVSINESIQKDTTPKTTLYQFIQSISNFNQLNIKDIPESVCVVCYQAAQLSMNFQTMCNNSAEKLRLYLEEAKKAPIFAIDPDPIDLTSQDSSSANPEFIESQESVENQEFNEKHEFVGNENSKKDDDNSDDSLSDVEQEYFRRLDKPSVDELLSDYFAKNNEKVECKVCDETYIRRNKVAHYKTHIAPFECKICQKAYDTEFGLIKHKESHETAKYLCSFCGMCVRTKLTLDNHILRHTNKRPYVCETCGSRFRCKQQHKRHLSIHTGEKPFMCPVCAKTFRLEQLLRQHMVVHAKVKPIQCKFCERRFTQKHALRSHVAKSCKGYKEDKETAENEEGKDANEISSEDDDNMDS